MRQQLNGQNAYDLEQYTADDTSLLHPIRLDNGTIIKCNSSAFVDNANPNYYTAYATDDNGYTYAVRWEITHPDPKNCDDQSLMCDWDNFTVRML
jgi:hypothetical protein